MLTRSNRGKSNRGKSNRGKSNRGKSNRGKSNRKSVQKTSKYKYNQSRVNKIYFDLFNDFTKIPKIPPVGLTLKMLKLFMFGDFSKAIDKNGIDFNKVKLKKNEEEIEIITDIKYLWDCFTNLFSNINNLEYLKINESELHNYKNITELSIETIPNYKPIPSLEYVEIDEYESELLQYKNIVETELHRQLNNKSSTQLKPFENILINNNKYTNQLSPIVEVQTLTPTPVNNNMMHNNKNNQKIDLPNLHKINQNPIDIYNFTGGAINSNVSKLFVDLLKAEYPRPIVPLYAPSAINPIQPHLPFNFTRQQILDLLTRLIGLIVVPVPNLYQMFRDNLYDIRVWINSNINANPVNTFYPRFLQHISTTYTFDNNNTLMSENYQEQRFRKFTTVTLGNLNLSGMQQLCCDAAHTNISNFGLPIAMMMWLMYHKDINTYISLIDNIQYPNYLLQEEDIWDFAKMIGNDQRVTTEFRNVPIQDFDSFLPYQVARLLVYYNTPNQFVCHCLAGRGRTGSVFLLFFIYYLFLQESVPDRLTFLTRDINITHLQTRFYQYFPGDSNELFDLKSLYTYCLFIKRYNTIRYMIAQFYALSNGIPLNNIQLSIYKHLSNTMYNIKSYTFTLNTYYISKSTNSLDVIVDDINTGGGVYIL